MAVKREGAVVRVCTQRLPSHILFSAKIVKSGGEPNLLEHAAVARFSEDSERWRHFADLQVKTIGLVSIFLGIGINIQGYLSLAVICF